MSNARVIRGLTELVSVARGWVNDCITTTKQLYWLGTDPKAVVYHGVHIDLDPSWAPRHLRDFVYRGLYEEPERQILDLTLAPDDRYLEIGGGIGYLTTHACRRVGDANVSVYEANPMLVPVIANTASRHGFHPTVTNAVLGDADGVAEFYVDPNFTISSLNERSGTNQIKVPKRQLRSELESFRPTYLMVDIEGAETSLLATEIFHSVRSICVELHPAMTGQEQISSLLVTLIGQGFSLDMAISRQNVAFLSR